jgi:hypothetical protein
MYPHERSLVKQLSDKPFALIGVNSDRDLDSIREIVKEKNITWRSFWNGPEGTSGPISTAWNVSGWPTIYVLDGEGKIRYKNVRGDAMDKALETLFAEMKQTKVAASPFLYVYPTAQARWRNLLMFVLHKMQT